MAQCKPAALVFSLALAALAAAPRGALADPTYDCTGVGVLTDSTSNAVLNADGQVGCISTPGATVTLYGSVDAAASLGDPNTATNFTYDGQDRLLSDTGSYDANNDSTSNMYDGQGRMINSTNSIAGETQYSYYAGDLLSEMVDPEGNTYNYTYQYYDGQQRLIQVQADVDGTVTQYQYDYNLSSGELQTVDQYDAEDRLIGMTQYTYYTGGLLDTVTDPTGNVIQFFYDPNTNDLTYTEYDNNPNVEYKYYYNPNGQLDESIDPLGNITNYNYDTAGNMLGATDPSGLTTLIYSAVPEPGTLALLAPALGLWGGVVARRRHRRGA